MRMTHTLLLAALIAAAPTLHAEEKTLRLYNWADYFAEDTLSRFTHETGIKVIYDVMDGSETLEAKMLAGNSGYDLIFPGDTVAERLMRAVEAGRDAGGQPQRPHRAVGDHILCRRRAVHRPCLSVKTGQGQSGSLRLRSDLHGGALRVILGQGQSRRGGTCDRSRQAC